MTHQIVDARLRRVLVVASLWAAWSSTQCSSLAGDVNWLADVTTAPTAPPAANIGRLAPLLTDDSGQAITTRDGWECQRRKIRDAWLSFLGPMPDPRPPVRLEVLRTESYGEITRQLVRYEGEPGLFVEGYLLRPHSSVASNRKWPGIVALHPTTEATIDEIAGVSGPDTAQIGLKLARRGFVVFCPRCFLWQDAASLEQAVERHRERHPGSLGMAKMLYDAMRGVDVLESLPEVDKHRIGAVGHSLGAKETLYLAAFDERVRVAVASEGGITFPSTNWDAPWYLGEAIRDETFPLNHHQLLGLIAPRPFLILGGESGPGGADGDRSWPLITAALPAWRLYGDPVRLGLLNHRQGHSLTPESFDRLAEWLQAYLAPEVAEIQSLLQHEIVGPELSLAEVQWYCDERVPAMPDVKTVEQWEQTATRIRESVLERIVFRGEAARWRDAATQVEWLDTIEGGPGYRIRKLRYEGLPGLWIPALLYEPENITGKVPAVLNVNGHTSLGKQYPPKQIRCINQAKRGMLALNVEWVGMGQLAGPGFDHYHVNQLDLCGTSGLAPFYLNMKRGLDVLLSLEHADPDRVAVTGLSGGGWQTIFISSLDARVKLANPVAGYSSFKTRVWHPKDLGDSEQTPNDLATICDYTHLTAMMAPRPTLLTYNLHDDCCFEGAYALEPVWNAAKPIFQLYGKETSLRSHLNDDPPAKHNYEVDNRQQLYRMLGDFFYSGDEKYDAREIPSEGEVRTEEALRVAMPEENQDFNKLALSLCKTLPRNASLPADTATAVAWQQSRRVQLREIVRAKDYEVVASQEGQEEKEGVKATFWKLRMGGVWTVPAVELVQGEPRRTAILVADEGRQSVAAKAAELLGAGYRVVAVDPFYLGESKIAQRDYLYALLVAAVGDRPLGLQASQVAAVARWATAQFATDSVMLIAAGPRSCTMALVAAALEDKALGSLVLHGSLGSLKEVIEQNWGVIEKPELFCFGLLESFDIKQIAALVAPRSVMFVGPGERAKTELTDLAAWYRLWQRDFDPLAAQPD